MVEGFVVRGGNTSLKSNETVPFVNKRREMPMYYVLIEHPHEGLILWETVSVHIILMNLLGFTDCVMLLLHRAAGKQCLPILSMAMTPSHSPLKQRRLPDRLGSISRRHLLPRALRATTRAKSRRRSDR